MRPEDSPAIKSLHEFAEKLPKEHRAELFRTAESFLHIGGGMGVMVGAMGSLASLAPTGAMKRDNQEKTSEYVSEKNEWATYLSQQAVACEA